MERAIDRQANKAHIELRDPEIGVSVRERTSAPMSMGVKFETEPFEIGGQLFNGATLDLTKAQTRALIKQLERGISLMERAEKAEADPTKFKNDGFTRADGQAASVIRQWMQTD